MATASADDIALLLGDRADEAIVDRIVNVGASLDEVSEALGDLEFERRFGEPREAVSPRIEEIRMILEELPYGEEPLAELDTDDDEYEGLTVVDAEELNSEPR